MPGNNNRTVTHQHFANNAAFQMLHIAAIAFNHQGSRRDHGTVNHGEGAPAKNTANAKENGEKRKTQGPPDRRLGRCGSDIRRGFFMIHGRRHY